MVYRRREENGESGKPVLNVFIDADRARVPPDTMSRVHLVAETRAVAEGIERDRPPLSLLFVLDVSGSMAGPPLEHVVQSIDRMVGLLEPSDKVGVVAFSDNATEVVNLQPVTSEAKSRVRARAHRLRAEGHTNVESGLKLAGQMLPPRGHHERQVLLVLSDGVPNRGATSSESLRALAKSYRPDVSISTLGYGAHHHEETLTSISSAGGGRYHFIADPAICDFEFAQAIGTQGDVVAEAVEVTIVPAARVEILRFLGKPSTRFAASGVIVSLPDMLDGSVQLTVAELALRPLREPGPWEIATASITYRKAGERALSTFERRLSIQVGSGGGELLPEVNAKVLVVRCDEVRAEARALADRGQFDGAAAVLRQWIRAVEQAPGFVAGDSSPLADAYELLLDEANAMERKPSAEDYRTFRRTLLTSSLADGGGSLSMMPRSMSTQSRIVMADVAGSFPKAHMEVLSGPDVGKRVALGARQIIGRTQAADIRVAHPSVSRQHTQIIAQGGQFLVLDLGSTNTTEVNGERLTGPRRLTSGDVLRVGDVKLRYQEE